MKALSRNCTGYLLLALLGVCLLAFPPLAATLELHHALGEADQDGHQHSPVLASQPAVPAPETPYRDHFVPRLLLTDLPARAPPAQTL
ncbi:MAG: hypothetical protein E6K68_00905 [Nitrospirae bacterium]|nr:MAG: hypothetical protein E6K68_00905 [Nitrospirota bacterium]